ncbi:carbohydrate kinase family protein [Thermosipho atlanticus]|uniref:Fructokinase n=1 Tax=Thermosipho atlanticus DSM 15807 TaxID=1123380 RepID=A0A1M5TVD2_9BACT|nr:carbohydrate kinase [Thermosipho atlanticus]SHH54752.1 fructokinase [Thermosipho atlanticus DSM 15807]
MILCAGEALIDMIGQKRKGIKNSDSFRPRVGGSPLNTVVGLARLGTRVAFLTKIGEDYFGTKIEEFLINEKVEIKYVFKSLNQKTPLAFIALSQNKVPEYDFYRQNTADLYITEGEIKEIDIEKFEIFHFGSISLIGGETAKNLTKLFFKAKEKGKIVSLDPNVRSNLIFDVDEYRKRLIKMMKFADVLKLSVEDMNFFVPNGTFESFVKDLKREDKLTILTMGEKGSKAIYRGKDFKVRAMKKGKVVDTTGCGDAYMAAVLYMINKKRNTLKYEDIHEIMNFASHIAGIVASKYGGASSMPMKEEVAF